MNGYEAIWIHEKGKGHFENNDLCDNQRGAWDIDRDCYSNITRTDNIER
jgi:F-box protein 11